MTNNTTEDYLDENFDYTKLTIPKLKRIMFENGIVDFPARAKKEQLLEIYKTNIHDKIAILKKKKKQDVTRSVNKYQSDRSSIIDLEENENDRSGGVFTSGRLRRAVSEVSVPIEERLKVIKNGSPQKKTEKKTENPASPKKKETNQDKSFLESIGTYLRDSSPRRNKINSPIKEEKKRIYVDVNSSDFSSSFFDVKSSSVTPKKKVQTEPTTRWGRPWPQFVLSIVFFIVSLVILKMLPYCEDENEFFCVRVPENGKLINGKLKCNKGFVFKSNILKDSCEKDDSKEIQQQKIVCSIVKKLEILKGNFVYGATRNYKIKLEDLTTNQEIVELLKRNPNIVIASGLVYSKAYRTTLRLFVEHYFMIAIYFFAVFLVFLILFRIWRKRRATIEERKASSMKITKEILNILLRQLLMSTKNSRFPSYVSLNQLKDVFVVDKNVWKLVEENVKANSNIRADVIDDKEIWEWVGPIIQNPDQIESLVL